MCAHQLPTQIQVDENARVTHLLPADDFITGPTVSAKLDI